MKLTGTKTESFVVDATEIKELIEINSNKINNIFNDLKQYQTELMSTTKMSSDNKESINSYNSIINNFNLDDILKKLENLSSSFNDFKNLETEIKSISSLNDGLIDLKTKIEDISSLSDEFKNLEIKLNDLSSTCNITNDNYSLGEFTFILEKDENGYSDTSWEEIIKKGQEIQYDYWKAAEDKYNKIWKLFPGWHGSSMAPVIKILCEEPEYHFKDTKRLPGRFQLSSTRRWSSCLRFYGTGTKVLKDDIAYGTRTDAPIGLYVEGKTKVQTSKGEMLMKPFEQTIDEVIICAMNGTLPIYLSNDQDRFCIRNTKILQHQGAQIGIKHGPQLNSDNYPFPSIQDNTETNVYLADPRFENLQMEGPHNNKIRQAAMLLSGNNIIISNLNMYGWMCGPYMHGGKNRMINGLTQHSGLTADGRRYCDENEIVSFIICQRSKSDGDVVSAIAGGFKQWILPKRSVVPSKGGWHNKGETLL